MQVVLSTIGKFHTFDLARQLERHQMLRMVLTAYPAFKLRNEGLPSERIRTFPWLHAPCMFAERIPAWMKRELVWQDRSWFDRFVTANLPECDIFHALSGSALGSGRCVQKRGSRYVCDRGSSHICCQDEILREEFDRQGLSFPGVDPRIVDLEQAEYETADAITVPSHFARRTFVEKGINPNKLFTVTYGVDLSRFLPVSKPSDGEFRILFVGNVSVRKGIPYLLKAFDQVDHPRKKLVIVGTLEKRLRPLLAPFLDRTNIEFRGHVPQVQLAKVMSESHVLVLPSVEEGAALVQAQAMASGCPVIATTNTGAEDLFQDGVEGFIVPIRRADKIAEKLQLFADDPHLQAEMRKSALKAVATIGGWDAYGEKMFQVFAQVLDGQTIAV